MEKKHYYKVYWTTYTWKPTRSGRVRTERRYYRQYDTEAEAVKKARRVAKNPYSQFIYVSERECWETPDPAPNGTLHVNFLGFVNWQEN